MRQRLFAGMKWWDAAVYGALLLAVVLMPIGWRPGVVGLMVLCVATAVKMIATRQVGNPSLSRLGRWTVVLMGAYWAVYLVSGLTSGDRTLGLERTMTRLPLVVLPLVALLSDSGYLKQPIGERCLLSRLGGVALAQWGVMTLIAAGSLVMAVVRLATGSPLSALMEENYYPMHHSYLALETVVAMCTGWYMLRRLMAQARRGAWLWVLAGSELLLGLMVVMSNSRAGLLMVALLVVIAAADMMIRGKRWKSTLVVLALLCVAGVGVYQVIPPQYKRMTYALKEIRAGRSGDIRTEMMRWGVAAVDGHWLTGLGSGDYETALQQQYRAHGFEEGIDCQMGTHNQYMESLLQCGLIGLALLTAFVVLPLFGRSDGRYWVRLMVMAIAIEIFFESMLGRQMGVQFIGIMYILLAYEIE